MRSLLQKKKKKKKTFDVISTKTAEPCDLPKVTKTEQQELMTKELRAQLDSKNKEANDDDKKKKRQEKEKGPTRMTRRMTRLARREERRPVLGPHKSTMAWRFSD